MNLRNVLRAYSHLRQLTDDESALLETLRAMNDSERELFVEALGPQKPVAKKSSKKAGKKSARASGMAAAISGSLQRSRSATGRLPEGVSEFCIAQVDDNGGLCGEVADHNVHHKQTDPDYHPFQPAASSAPSPPDQASSEIGKADVLSAAQGAGGGS